MIKSVFALILFFGVAAQSFAEVPPTVEIKSFLMAGTRTRAAEICGKVSGMTSSFVTAKVLVDPKSDRPGTYNVIVGDDGKFCVTVITYTGRAEAILWGTGSTPKFQISSGIVEVGPLEQITNRERSFLSGELRD